MPNEMVYAVRCDSCGRAFSSEQAFSDPTGPKPLCSFCDFARGVALDSPDSYSTPTERCAIALERIAAATEEWLPRIAVALENICALQMRRDS